MKKAFTLIELLIVVAIIAILAAIAVPNFLEAQTRAKISRAKNDMRTMTTALESYYVDNNRYPPCHQNGIPGPAMGDPVPPGPTILLRLSTPIGYINNSIYQNPFNATQRVGQASVVATLAATPVPLDPINLGDPVYRSYLYQSGSDNNRTNELNSSGAPVTSSPESDPARKWILHSPGPNQVYINMGGILANSSGDPGMPDSTYADCLNLIYDPTNGTISVGAIWRVGGTAGNSFYGQQMMKAAQESGK